MSKMTMIRRPAVWLTLMASLLCPVMLHAAAPGNALSFGSGGTYVDVGAGAALNFTGAMTIEAWIKPNSASDVRTIFGHKVSGWANPGYAFYINSFGTTDAKLIFETQSQAVSTTAAAITWGVWQHVAVTWDGTVAHIYVNGVEQASGGSVSLVSSTANGLIGAFRGTGKTPYSDFFQGTMDEVRIWNVARTQEELRDAMHIQLIGTESGLQAYYRFSEGSGTTTADLAGNDNNGTLVSGPAWTTSTVPMANVIASWSNLRGVWAGTLTSLSTSRLFVSGATLTSPAYVLFGHDNTTDDWQTTDVPMINSVRLTRVWQPELSGSVTGAIRIDTTGLSGIGDGSNLRLMVDSDGTFASGATMLTGSYSAPFFTVSGHTVLNGMYYTLGNVRMPDVATAAVTNITPVAAQSGGNVTNEGDSPVTSRGICWAITENPSLADTCVTNGSGPGEFTGSLTGLTPDQIYYVRAFATNSYGTAYGEASSFTTPMTSPGYAMQFDGTNDYVAIADADDLDLTANYTLETWFRADLFGSLRGLISKYQAVNAKGYLLRLTGTNLDFDEMTTSGLNLQPGKWYHVAAVNDNGTRRLYVNGVEKTLTGTPLTVAANTDQLTIGSDFLLNNNRYFRGRMDEVRIWNCVRTQTEIQDAMHKQLRGNENGLVAYYRFNQTSGTALTDLTSYNHTGTLTNMTDGAWQPSTAPLAAAIEDRASIRGIWDGNLTSLATGRFQMSGALGTAPEYALLGHDNAADGWQANDLPSGTTGRLTRIWQSEVSGSAAGDIVIDTTGLDTVGDGSGLRLLVDADGVFAADATVLAGTYSAPYFTVSGHAITNGFFYTLGKNNWVLTVTVSGSGIGTISSAPGGITCQKSGGEAVACSNAFTGDVTLSATPATNSVFSGWSTCGGTGTCDVIMDGDKTVTGTFNMLRIGTKYLTLQAVYDAAPTGSVIELLQSDTGQSAGTLSANRDIAVRLSGGYDATYENITGMTTITGPLHVSGGKVIAKNIMVK